MSIEVKILLVYKNNGIRSKLKVCMFGEGWMGGGGADLSEIGERIMVMVLLEEGA